MNGLFGVGGGFMVVPALIVVLGFPTRLAIGTSLSIIACISLGGVVGHLQFGRINWPLTAWVLVGVWRACLLGVRVGSMAFSDHDGSHHRLHHGFDRGQHDRGESHEVMGANMNWTGGSFCRTLGNRLSGMICSARQIDGDVFPISCFCRPHDSMIRYPHSLLPNLCRAALWGVLAV
jgi:hypothetical protein